MIHNFFWKEYWELQKNCLNIVLLGEKSVVFPEEKKNIKINIS